MPLRLNCLLELSSSVTCFVTSGKPLCQKLHDICTFIILHILQIEMDIHQYAYAYLQFFKMTSASHLIYDCKISHFSRLKNQKNFIVCII